MPGDVTLLVAGLIASQGSLNLGLLIAIASIGAICGDSVGYFIGRYGGINFVRRYGRYFFFKESHLEKTQRYFDYHGGKTILFGRFIAVIKSVGPVAAGIGRMPYGTFLAYNVVGSILSVTLYLVIGYFFGASWEAISTWAGRGAAIAFGVIVITAAIVVVVKRRRNRRLRNGASSGPGAAGKTGGGPDSAAEDDADPGDAGS